MSLAAVVVAAFLATAAAVASLWRGTRRQPWLDQRPYLWFAVAAGLTSANMIVSQTVSLPAGNTAMVVSFADVPALLFLPAMAVGLAELAAGVRGSAAEAQSRR